MSTRLRTKRPVCAFTEDVSPGLSTHAHQALHAARERSLPRAFTHETTALQTLYVPSRGTATPVRQELGPILPRASKQNAPSRGTATPVRHGTRAISTSGFNTTTAHEGRLPRPSTPPTFTGWNAGYDTTATSSSKNAGDQSATHVSNSNRHSESTTPRMRPNTKSSKRRESSIGGNILRT